MNRRSARLKQHSKEHHQHANTINGFAARNNTCKETGGTRGTVNQGHAIQEDGTENGTGNKVLEHALAGIKILAAKPHQGIHREGGQFHSYEQGKEINCLNHEHGTGRSQEHKTVGFTTLAALVTKSPLQARNSQKGTQQHRYGKQTAHGVHGKQVKEGIVRNQCECGSGNRDKQRCHPREDLMLVLVPDKWFRGDGCHGTHHHQDYGQKIDVITHFRMPPSLQYLQPGAQPLGRQQAHQQFVPKRPRLQRDCP